MRIDDLKVKVAAAPLVSEWNVNTEVYPQHIVALVAEPSIALAFARTVVGLRPPVSGAVRVGTQILTWQPTPWWHRTPRDVVGSSGRVTHNNISYIPAGGALLPHLSVRDNIDYCPYAGETVRNVREARIDDLVDKLELEAIIRRYPHQITPRQRLRVALARAVVGAPEAMVLHLPVYDEISQEALAEVPQVIQRCTPHTSAGFAVLVCTTVDTLPAVSGIVRPTLVGPGRSS